jgi:hypothetical protein
MAMSELPFRIDDLGGIVLVHGFEEIHRHFEGHERELPTLRDAVREQVERDRRAFVFDLRTAEPIAAYPIVKWGAMYGVVSPLKRLFAAGDDRGASAWRASSLVKLVVAEEQMAELRIYKMTDIFGAFAELEEAVRALRAT